MSVVTRFPPSPTGYLHVGGARTALYNWLRARQSEGRMILRIEDTDRERSTDESVQAILDGMAWLGLDYDEGPHFQTQRFDRYKEVIQQLIDTGHAYPCFCSREELDAMREAQRERGEKPRYDGRCRHREDFDPDAPAVIRFKNPLDGAVRWDDLVKGPIAVSNGELDDLIIARSDGSPTYNLTVVVDDLDMGITEVIRGDDHVNNTPRQINIFQALEAAPPRYGHVPMILGPDGARLSKRHGAVSVMQYREEGYLPAALRNYLVRLGWSHGDQEVFSTEEMLQHFEVSQVQRAAARFDVEKLNWLNQHYLKATPAGELVDEYLWHLARLGLTVDAAAADWAAIIEAHRERCKTLRELAQSTRFYVEEPGEYAEKDVKKHFREGTADLLADFLARSRAAEPWSGAVAHEIVQAVCAAREVGMGKLGQPLRIAVSGAASTPALDITLGLLGRERTEARVERAIAYLREAT
mgnify:CR=1 FL=1